MCVCYFRLDANTHHFTISTNLSTINISFSRTAASFRISVLLCFFRFTLNSSVMCDDNIVMHNGLPKMTPNVRKE